MIYLQGLADEVSLSLVEKKTISRQIFTRDVLQNLVADLQANVEQPWRFEFEELDAQCIEKLTGLVTYERLVFANSKLTTRLCIELGSGNEFPVFGADLWLIGVDSLPGGVVKISSDDDEVVSIIAESIIKFDKEL